MWRDALSRSAWLAAGSVLGRLLPYLVLIGLGRLLPPQEFATLAVGFAWSAVAANLTTSGLATLATQRLALITDGPTRHRFILRVTGLGLGLVLLLNLLVLAVGRQAMAQAFGQVLIPAALAPAIANGVAWSLTLLAIAALNGLHQARAAAFVLSLGGLLQGLGLLVGHLQGGGLAGILWGLAMGSLCALCWAGWQLVHALNRSPSGEAGKGSSPDPHRHFWSALAWNTLAAACVMPVTWMASSLLTHGPQGARQLAAFHALEQLHQLAIFIPGVIGQALLPTLTVHLHGNPEQGVRHLVRLAAAVGLAGIAVAAVLAWEPQWLHHLVGNPALTDAAATRWMLLHAGLALGLSLLGSALLARGLYALASSLNLVWAATFLALGWLWAHDGAAGLQLARLCASSLLFVAAGALLWHLSAPVARPLRQ